MAIAIAGALGMASNAGAFSYNDSAANGVPPGGDLVGVWSKAGTELIVNFGAVGDIAPGDMVNVAIPAQFGGTLDGANFTMFAVPNLSQELPGFPGVPQENIVLTSGVDPTAAYGAVPDGFLSVANSFAQLNNWLDFLTTAPAADGTTVFENTASRLVVKNGGSGAAQQYEDFLGLGTDQIANTSLLPTTIAIGPTSYQVGLYQITKNAQGFADVVQLFNLVGDPETGKLTFVPEPGSLLLLGAGIAGLAAFGKRRAA